MLWINKKGKNKFPEQQPREHWKFPRSRLSASPRLSNFLSNAVSRISHERGCFYVDCVPAVWKMRYSPIVSWTVGSVSWHLLFAQRMNRTDQVLQVGNISMDQKSKTGWPDNILHGNIEVKVYHNSAIGHRCEKKHAYLCRWRLLHESLGWGWGLENLLGKGRSRAWEPPGRELLACRGDDIAGLLGWLWHEGWWVNRAGWGLRSLSWGLPAQVHLAELCRHIISLQDTKIKQEISEISLVTGEAHRDRHRPHACHCRRSREYTLEK